MSARDDLAPHALAYARRGWCILPIVGKRCPIRWARYRAARPTEATLRRWFARPDVTGLAVLCGPASGGLVARDFDDTRAYHRWAEANPEHARRLPTVKTGRGFHVYLRWPVECFATLGDGELRGDSGHYVALPPSRHPSGVVYRWVVPLPDGDLPTIDPAACGLNRAWIDEPAPARARNGQRAEGECAPPPPPMSCVSVSSVSIGAPSVSIDDPRVLAAIDATLPGGPGRRNRALFAFLRRLAAIPALSGREAAAIRPLVAEWHRRALSAIGTKDWESTWADAARAWTRIKVPHGAGPFADALERAKSAPDPACGLAYDRADVRLLVRLCFALAEHHAPRPFPLPCRLAAEAIGTNRTDAAGFLGMLAADDVIRLVRRGHTGRASEYVWIGGGG